MYNDNISSDGDIDSSGDRKQLNHRKKRRVKRREKQKYRRRAKSFMKDIVEEHDGSSNTLIKESNCLFPSWFRF